MLELVCLIVGCDNIVFEKRSRTIGKWFEFC